MKASSAGLEIEASISPEEVISLRTLEVQGILRFDDTMIPGGTIKRNIPISLRYNPELRSGISVNTSPEKCYFGKIDHCTFTLDYDRYQSLIQRGSCGSRFFSSGKILIKQQ